MNKEKRCLSPRDALPAAIQQPATASLAARAEALQRRVLAGEAARRGTR